MLDKHEERSSDWIGSLGIIRQSDLMSPRAGVHLLVCHVLILLQSSASRGSMIINGHWLEKAGVSTVPRLMIHRYHAPDHREDQSVWDDAKASKQKGQVLSISPHVDGCNPTWAKRHRCFSP